MKFNYQVNSSAHQIEVTKEVTKAEDGYQVNLGDANYIVQVQQASDGKMKLIVDGQAVGIDLAEDNGKLWVAIAGRSYLMERVSKRSQLGAGSVQGGNLVTAPMPGQMREVLVAVGDTVKRGQTMLLLEAMKMEMRILAPCDGLVVTLAVKVGQQVDKEALLVEVE